ncbi:MAG TPA: alpha/beta hydrolase [Pseudonocardiaceae bacterium]|nr:alpha/beta hydrolase [Pseudonocardiaceae bacterium]
MKLSVREWGNGDRLAILVHGASGTAESMRPFAEQLVDRGYRVLAPDLRGHGSSPRGGPYSLAALAADLVESLPPGAELVAGHSFGGKLLPLAVSGLRPARAMYLDPAWIAPLGPAGGLPLAKDDGTPMAVADLRAVRPEADEAVLRDMVARYLATDWRMFHEPRVKLRQHTPPPLVAEVPSLVVRADPSELVDDLADRLRAGGYEVRTQPGAGHGLFQEDMDAFLATVAGWI